MSISIGSRVQVAKLDPIPVDSSGDTAPDQNAPVEVAEQGTVDFYDNSPDAAQPVHVQFDSGRGQFFSADELTVLA